MGFNIDTDQNSGLMVVGSPYSNVNGPASGQVNVYSRISNNWTQIGQTIYGLNIGDGFGWDVAISGDTIVVSSVGEDQGNSDAGVVRVYRLSNGSWVQLGSDIAEGVEDERSGESLDFRDGRLAVGSRYSRQNSGGRVRIYEYNGTNWIQKGANIDGPFFRDRLGASVAIDHDTIIVGATNGFGTSGTNGYVAVYVFGPSGSWQLRGPRILSQLGNGRFGHAVAIDKGRIAISDYFSGVSSLSSSGEIATYRWNGSSYALEGSRIFGDSTLLQLGYSIDLVADSLYVGGIGYRQFRKGQVRKYIFGGQDWILDFQHVSGEFDDLFGRSVKALQSGVAIGVPESDVFGPFAGYVMLDAPIVGLDTCSRISDLYGISEIDSAIYCLCNNQIIGPSLSPIIDSFNVFPQSLIFRADLAKLIWFALNGGDIPSIAEAFPTPFADLQQVSSNDYYRYARALSYLEYDDYVAPFDRDFINFRPYETIEVRYAIKVLLEAFDIAPDNTNNGSIYGLQPTDDGYGYIQVASSMGLISSTISLATDDIERGQMFYALFELLDVCNGSTLATIPASSDYFVPGQFTPYNLTRNVGVSDGYFRSHTSTSFAIPGRGLALSYGHTYNSYLTELPREYRLLEPLGRGWSHTYDSYVLFEEGWTFDNITQADEYVVSLPGGQFYVFDANTLSAKTEGSRMELTRPNPQALELTLPDQIVYTYTSYVLPQGYTIFMLDAIVDRNGNKLDIVNEVETITGPNAGDFPRVKEVVDDLGRKLTFTYAANSMRLIGVSDLAGGRSISYTSNPQVNDPAFAKTLDTYVNALGDATTYTYGSAGSVEDRFCLLTSITLPEGNVVTNTYDAARKLASVSLPGQTTPSAAVAITPNYENTSADYTTSVTAPSPGGTTISTNAYTDKGYLKSSERNNKTRSYTYGSTAYPNQPTRSTYEGRSVDYSYDSEGRVTAISFPLNITHSFSYNSRNDVVSYTDPRNSITLFTYDSNGNLVQVEDAEGGFTDIQNDSYGRVTQVRNPSLIATDYTYHNDGPLATVSRSTGQVYAQLIDAIGRVTESTDGNGNRQTFDYDALDRVTEMIREGLNEEIKTEYSYDKNGNLTAVTNALNGVTSLGYDNRDLLTSVDFGDDGLSYSYLENGQLDEETTPNADVFTQVYDTENRLIDDGYATYTYDNFNRVVSVTRGTDVLTYAYDDADRITSIDYNGEPVAYGYDAAGNTTTVTHAGFTSTYTYDQLNRLTRVRWSGGTGSTGVTYAYHADGRMKSATNPNGTKREYYYDQVGRLNELVEHVPATMDTIAYFTYVYDNNDNINVETSAGRFTLTPPVYTAADDSYTYNGENEISTGPASSYGFDSNGNQLNKGGVAATWDSRNRLLTNGALSYTYDPAGMRRSRTEAGTTHDYVLDARGMGHVLAEKENGVVKYRYVHGAGLTLRIDVANGNAEHFYHFDYRGSTVAMTDASAAVTHTYRYLPYGEVVQRVEVDAQPFTYVGRNGVMDEGDDTYFMRARYYDAESGRFMSEDPVWHDNLYPYADNNPVKMIDPTGNTPDIQTAYSNVPWWKQLAGIPIYTAKGAYEYGTASDEILLSQAEFSNFTAATNWDYYTEDDVRQNWEVTFEDGSTGYAHLVRASGAGMGYLGTFTIYTDTEGEIVGLYDLLDYDYKWDDALIGLYRGEHVNGGGGRDVAVTIANVYVGWADLLSGSHYTQKSRPIRYGKQVK